MSKLYIFGIGGTGSRVLRSLTMMLSAGVRLKNGIDEIVPIIIDPDCQNGDLLRTVDLMNNYMHISENLTFSEENKNTFFKTRINRILQNFTYTIKDTNDRKFKEFVNVPSMNRETQAMMKMLFSEKNLESSMDVGFKGNPNIGSVVLNQIAMSDDFTNIANSFSQGDRIFIISSIFGGTGASGFPLLLKTLRTEQSIPNHSLINNALIGAVTILPYFKVKQDNESEIDSSTFISKTKSALAYYENNIVKNEEINALYYLADEPKNSYDNNEGKAAQRNDAHLVEFLAATAIVDFCNSDVTTDETRNNELGIKDINEENSATITFSSFHDGLKDMLAEPLTQLTLTANFFNDKFSYVSSSTLSGNGKLGLSTDFYRSSFVKNLQQHLYYYRDWLSELKSNKRSLDLFNLECGDKPFTVMTDITEKRVMSLKSNYDLFYDELSTVAKKKCQSRKAEDKLLEMYSLATKELYEKKFNI